MQCEKFEARMHDLLDLGLRPEADDALVRHAALCPSCYPLLAGQELLLEGLELGEIPPISEDFARRVVAGLPTVRRSRPLRRATAMFVAALTAAVLIGLFPWIRGFWMEPSPTHVVETVPEKAPTDGSASPGEASLLANSPEAVPALEPPAGGPDAGERPRAWELEDWTARFPAMESLPTVSFLLGGPETPRVEAPAWITRVAGSLRPLRPVADSMVGALNVIRGTLPGIRGEQPRDPQAGGPSWTLFTAC